MIEFSIVRTKPSLKILRAYLYQLINSDFVLAQEIIKILKNKHKFYGNNCKSWNLKLLKISDLKNLLQQTGVLPREFFYFESNSFSKIENLEDFRIFPEIYSKVQEVSFDKGGLIVMQFFNCQIYKLFDNKGKEITDYCHDLELGINGKVLLRYVNDTSGYWRLYKFTGKGFNKFEKFFSSFDSPSDFPLIKKRDLIPEMFYSKKIPAIFQEYKKLSKEQVIIEINKNEYNYRYLSKYYRNDSELAKVAINQSKYAFLSLSQRLKKNKEFVIEVLKANNKNTAIYPYLNNTLKKDEDIVALCLSFNPKIISNIRPISNRELLIRAINLYSLHLFEYASFNLKKDKKLILEFACKDWRILRYVPENLLLDICFINQVIDEFNYSNLSSLNLTQNIDEETQSHCVINLNDVVRYLINYNCLVIKLIAPVADFELLCQGLKFTTIKTLPKYLKFIHPDILKNKLFWISAIQSNSNVFRYVPKEFIEDRELLLKAIKHDGNVVEWLSPKYKNDSLLFFEAIKQITNRIGDCNPEIIMPYLGNKLKMDIKFTKKTILVWPHILKHINDELKSNAEIFFFAVKVSYAWVVNYADDKLLNNIEYVCSLIDANPGVYEYLPNSIKFDSIVNDFVKNNHYFILSNKSDLKNTENDLLDDDLPF